MARSKRFRKNEKRESSHKRNHRLQTSTNQTAVSKKDAPSEISVKRRKITVRDDVSSESEDEIDPFSNLLSSFNVQQAENVVETDESDSSDSDDQATERSKEIYVDDDADDISEEESDGDSNDGVSSGEDDEIESDSDCVKNDVVEADEIDIQTEEVDDVDTNDPFVKHLKYDLDENMLEIVQCAQPKIKELHDRWPVLGLLKFYLPDVKKRTHIKISKLIDDEKAVFAPQGSVPSRITSIDLSKLQVKSQLHGNIVGANVENLKGRDDMIFSPLQKEIFTILNNYQDLYFPSRVLENGEEVRFIYTLHAINHVLKTRTKIVHHNFKVQSKDDVPDEYRDQGLVRPRVLIIVPFKDSAFRIIKMIISLLHPNDKGHVIKKARFLEEFTGSEIKMPYKKPRPEDYEKTFSGNTDDNFKIGLSITRKSLKLFVDFYSADIIIASPLGLRVIIGAEGEPNREYDFLASLEILIFDQAEIFLMQNWEHVLHIMNHLHLQPKESHGTDFARVRTWAINGWARFYRQTLLFSSHTLPEINSLFNKKCSNYAGRVRIEKLYEKGSVCQVVLQLSQVFHRFIATGGQSTIDARFDFFVKKIIPQFSDTTTSHVLVYVPSYFDYVRVRNYFKREDMSFVQICEYSKDGKIARARDLFFHNEAHFLLYSERAHFFRRFRIKGIRHIIFYQPPSMPHFYSELCNFMAESNMNQGLGCESKSVTVLYARSDGLQLAATVGTERAARMLSSDRDVHMFVSGE